MPRIHKDWLQAFMGYAGYLEAPPFMHFWAGVSAIAGALQRKVWIDQAYFQWYPNFYIIFVAPPGIVSKTTTVDVGMKLLREVEGVNFGPDVVTWEALVEDFSRVTTGFELNGTIHTMSAMTLESGELGNLLDPDNRDMVDLLVSLWDGKQGAFKKSTKTAGKDEVVNPWINLIACTTPTWISGNVPEYMVGGGLTSRMVFVYAEDKHKLVAYPGRHVPPDLRALRDSLIADLRAISRLAGEYKLTEEAYAWGEAWYEQHYKTRNPNLDKEKFGGYIARKQTHIHKLAMVIAASQSDELLITKEHLATAEVMITDLEPDMQFVFSKIGRSDLSLHLEKLITFVEEHSKVEVNRAYKHVHQYFPSMREFEDALAGCIKAGRLTMIQEKGIIWLTVPSENGGTRPPETPPNQVTF